MKTYFSDENLLDSTEYNYLENKTSYLLYETISVVYPFVKFEEEIRAMNDYCVFIIRQLRNRLLEIAEMANYKVEFTSDKKEARESIAFFEEAFDYPGTLLTWEILSADINKCTMLLLWLSYLESSLREISKWFSEMQNIPFVQKKKGTTGVMHYLDVIGECCKCHLKEDLSKELAYYDKVRKVRNQFVHNEWEQITDRDEQFRLDQVVHLVSTVIAVIEKRACQAGLISEFSF